jgi:hypothetical protein
MKFDKVVVREDRAVSLSIIVTCFASIYTGQMTGVFFPPLE